MKEKSMFIERVLFVCVLVVGLSFTSVAQKADCGRVNSYYNKKVCSGIENNQAAFIKDLMQRRSSANNRNEILAWTKNNYECFYCEDEPGFRGGTLLRKVVFENALNICFFFVYDARVDLNAIERDGRTLIAWLQDDTEKAFDAAFETENDQDKKYLIKQIQTGQKYFNIFRNNGAKFRNELK
ncbi:hypothetical protein N9J52_01180 [Flavobacteriales bacterium]|nr:hypothetical protein [Flavobacteriales bacterium]